MGKSKRRKQWKRELDRLDGLQSGAIEDVRKFQAALSRTTNEMLDDPNFVDQNFLSRLPQLRAEFGKGFLLIDLGFYSSSSDCFVPCQQSADAKQYQAVYFDRDSFRRSLASGSDFDGIWTQLEPLYQQCSDAFVLIVFFAQVDLGIRADPRFINLLETKTLSTSGSSQQPILPMKLTSKQIDRALEQCPASQLLVLDTSQPQFTGVNLEKWLRAVRSRQARNQPCPKIIIDSSPEYPALLPPDLQAEAFPLQFSS